MARPFHLMLWCLLALGLAGGGYAYRQGATRQRALLAAVAQAEAGLRPLNEQRAASARATTNQIRVDVCRNESQKNDLVVWRTAQQVDARARSLADTLRRLRAGTDPTAAELAQAATHLDRFLALTGRTTHNPYWPADFILPAGASVAGWFGEEFGDLPAAVRRAVFTRLESQVWYAGAAVLSGEARKVGTSGCGGYYHLPVALALATSQTVAPGAEYRAQLFLVDGYVWGLPWVDVRANGVPLLMTREQGGAVALPIPAAQDGQPDTLTTAWQGSIRFRRCLLPDTVWHLIVPYFIVRKPLTP